jgi:hypothetical protein
VDAAIIQRLSLLPQLHAMGFFTINRTTFTSVLGTIVTYLIILIQFEAAEPK